MDYRELLKKYMAMVRYQESVTYLGLVEYDRKRLILPINEEELAELRKIEAELPPD